MRRWVDPVQWLTCQVRTLRAVHLHWGRMDSDHWLRMRNRICHRWCLGRVDWVSHTCPTGDLTRVRDTRVDHVRLKHRGIGHSRTARSGLAAEFLTLLLLFGLLHRYDGSGTSDDRWHWNLGRLSGRTVTGLATGRQWVTTSSAHRQGLDVLLVGHVGGERSRSWSRRKQV